MSITIVTRQSCDPSHISASSFFSSSRNTASSFRVRATGPSLRLRLLGGLVIAFLGRKAVWKENEKELSIAINVNDFSRIR